MYSEGQDGKRLCLVLATVETVKIIFYSASLTPQAYEINESKAKEWSSHLLHEEDEDLPEELDEVDEEVEGVADGVLVAPPPLLDDGLGVVHHEAAEDQQAAPQVQLEQGGAPANVKTHESRFGR